jgi:hypothetical protein
VELNLQNFLSKEATKEKERKKNKMKEKKGTRGNQFAPEKNKKKAIYLLLLLKNKGTVSKEITKREKEEVFFFFLLFSAIQRLFVSEIDGEEERVARLNANG